MNDLGDRFRGLQGIDYYQRIDEDHPLDLYIGLDDAARWTILMVCPSKPNHFTSSRMIYGKTGQRNDGRWTVSLSLVDKQYQDMFVLFCGDIIESSRSINNKDNGARFFIQRYEEWKRMLANTNGGLLSTEVIKGLLGEMFVLETELMDKYGPETSALSWTGPSFAHQDFIIDDTWYEVKTVSSGKDAVSISSVEQLDCSNKGHMVVVFADKTSTTDEHRINLNMVYYRLLAKMKNDEAKVRFSSMLLKYGYYPRSEYEDEEYSFRIKSVQHYLVNEEFPCLRRCDIPISVGKAEYSLSLPAIQCFRED